MPCLALPPLPPLPALPAGVSIPIFTPPPIPGIGINFCCQISLPPIPLPAVGLTIAFPAAVITTLNTITKAVQTYYDSIGVSCPFE